MSVMGSKRLKAVDLFCGCGGKSLGFQNAGIDIVAAYDNWEAAITCYEDNFDHPVHNLDLSNTKEAITSIQSYSPDIIIGGPPCQDFSHAGKRTEGKRADLTNSFAVIVAKIKPEFFVMENVDRIQKSNAYKNARTIFKKAGYSLTEVVLDASRCNVPQKRKRFFCIGKLNGHDNFINHIIEKNISNKSLTVRDYLGNEFGVDAYYRHPRNYNRRGIFSIDEPSPTVRGVNRPVPNGYKGHKGDPVPLSENIRSLTTFERARLQTFPKDFKWTGTKTNLELMIGNAVAVNLAEFIANALIELIDDNFNLKLIA